MTQITEARRDCVTKEMRFVATQEGLDAELVKNELRAGRLVIPANINHTGLEPAGIGIATRCKINANLGATPSTSLGTRSSRSDIERELDKLRTAVKYGADAVMDLSTGPDIDALRTAMIAESRVPLGTVPIYEITEHVSDIKDISIGLVLEILEKQASQGVDFMTLHCGLRREMIPLARKRLTGIVSRGGSIIVKWMEAHGKENPLYTHYDEILKIAAKYDVTLSLGDGLRPGSLADASDEAQFAELKILGELTLEAWKKDVQVMIEGPGHIPFNEIEFNVRKEIELCHGAPFYVLGPLVTDIAAGYDHIASAIGGTMAAYSGASMLCYVTPKEHLGLPELEDVRVGVIAHKIAAHAADVARGRTGARLKDDNMSRARFAFEWGKQFEYALDPDRAKEYRCLGKGNSENEDHCSMCGPKFCAMKTFKESIDSHNS